MVKNEFGRIIYYNEQGQWHREDGPAVEYADGQKHWYINGLKHRIDGPAIEYVLDGRTAYYIMGKHYSYEEWLAIKDYSLLW